MAKNGGGYTQTGVAKGLKVPCLFMISEVSTVVKVRGARGGSAPCFDFGGVCPPLLESEPSLPTAGPKLLNSTKNHNVRCRINKF